MMKADTTAVIQKVSFHPNASIMYPSKGVASAGPSPQAAIRMPIPSPRCLRNQVIADGISGTRNIACATPSITPNVTYSCHTWLMTPVSIIPMMNSVQPIIMALRAPSLSPSEPAIGEASAVTTLESA